jgi:hypothetical protein
MRRDGEQRFVFICNTERKTGRFTVPPVILSLKGRWKIEIMDPFTGTEKVIPSELSSCGHWTNINQRMDGCSSLLLRLSPGAPNPTLHHPLVLAEEYRRYAESQLKRVDMSTSNMLLLDYAGYKFEDDESWNSMEEVLRIDNIIQSRLGMPLKLEAYKQPLSISEEERKPVAKLELRFRFFSEVKIENAQLVMEEPE